MDISNSTSRSLSPGDSCKSGRFSCTHLQWMWRQEKEGEHCVWLGLALGGWLGLALGVWLELAYLGCVVLHLDTGDEDIGIRRHWLVRLVQDSGNDVERRQGLAAEDEGRDKTAGVTTAGVKTRPVRPLPM
eukprot:364465-Chlamydomonas_euryale.AAC.10